MNWIRLDRRLDDKTSLLEPESEPSGTGEDVDQRWRA